MANKKSKDKNKTFEKIKFVTHPFRVSYPHLFEMHDFKGNKAYQITMLFPKSVDLKKPAKDQLISMKKAAENAAIEKWGPKEDWPDDLRMPFRDGDEEFADKEGYEDMIVVIAKNKKNRPQLIDLNFQPITDEEDFYPGCWARAQLIACAYDDPDPGIMFNLQSVQKIRDDEPLTSGSDLTSVFAAPVDDDDDDIPPPKKKPSKKKPVDDDDDDDDDIPPPKKKPSKKKPVDDDDDAEEEEDDIPPPKKKSGKKPAVEEDEDDDEPVRPKKKK